MGRPYPLTYLRTTTWCSGLGPLKASPLRSATSCLVGHMLRNFDQCSSNRPNPSDHDVLSKLDGYDPERGVKVVGHRGYFLKQWGVFLNQYAPPDVDFSVKTLTQCTRAIINYGLEFLSDKFFIPLQTPQLMLREQMAKTAQLSQ